MNRMKTDAEVQLDLCWQVMELYGIKKLAHEGVANAIGRLADRLKKEREPYDQICKDRVALKVLLSELSHSWVNGRRVIDGCDWPIAERVRAVIEIADTHDSIAIAEFKRKQADT